MSEGPCGWAWQSEAGTRLPLPAHTPDVLTEAVPQGHSIWALGGWKRQSQTDLHFMVDSDTACCMAESVPQFPHL